MDHQREVKNIIVHGAYKLRAGVRSDSILEGGIFMLNKWMLEPKVVSGL